MYNKYIQDITKYDSYKFTIVHYLQTRRCNQPFYKITISARTKGEYYQKFLFKNGRNTFTNPKPFKAHHHQTFHKPFQTHTVACNKTRHFNFNN